MTTTIDLTPEQAAEAPRNPSAIEVHRHFTNFHNAKNVRFGFDYTPGGSELLNYLIRQAAVPEYQVRWRWTPNSFAIWDNRCTQHYAVQDYLPAVRRMERAGIVGDKTF